MTKRVVVPFRLRTAVTERIHNTKVADDDVVGEGCFGVVFKGAFRGEDVPIKMKDADATRWRSSRT